MQGCAATNLTGAVFFLDFCTVLRQRLTGRLPNTSDTQVTQDHCFSINATQRNLGLAHSLHLQSVPANAENHF